MRRSSSVDLMVSWATRSYKVSGRCCVLMSRLVEDRVRDVWRYVEIWGDMGRYGERCLASLKIESGSEMASRKASYACPYLTINNTNNNKNTDDNRRPRRRGRT